MVRIVEEDEVFLLVSGQPGPKKEERVKDQFGGRMRWGSVGAEARARVMRRERVVVVYSILRVRD